MKHSAPLKESGTTSRKRNKLKVSLIRYCVDILTQIAIFIWCQYRFANPKIDLVSFTASQCHPIPLLNLYRGEELNHDYDYALNEQFHFMPLTQNKNVKDWAGFKLWSLWIFGFLQTFAFFWLLKLLTILI